MKYTKYIPEDSEVDSWLELSLPDVGESTWLDVELLPWGCTEIICLEKDGSETPMCSCDFFWRKEEGRPIAFKFDNSEYEGETDE